MTIQEFEYKEGEDYEESGMWYWIDPEHHGYILINNATIKKRLAK